MWMDKLAARLSENSGFGKFPVNSDGQNNLYNFSTLDKQGGWIVLLLVVIKKWRWRWDAALFLCGPTLYCSIFSLAFSPWHFSIHNECFSIYDPAAFHCATSFDQALIFWVILSWVNQKNCTWSLASHIQATLFDLLLSTQFLCMKHHDLISSETLFFNTIVL